MKVTNTNLVKWFATQLVIFGLLAFAVFLLLKFFDSLPSNSFVEETATNFYSLREFILTLFFRITPFLVPITLATSSFMLNRYTEAFFGIVFQEPKVKTLIKVFVFYFVLHTCIVFSTPVPISEDHNDYYINFFVTFVIDTLFASAALYFTVQTCIEVFTYTQPTRLIKAIKKQIRQHLNQLLEYLFENKTLIVEDVIKYSHDLRNSIGTFTNLTVIAVKAKDYDTIKESIKTIGDVIWDSVSSSLVIKKETINEMREQILKDCSDEDDVELLLDHRISLLREVTSLSQAIAEQQIVQVYHDIFETAFSSKEFFACDEILTQLESMSLTRKGVTIDKLFEIHSNLFGVVLSYNYHGYTIKYCKKITNNIKSIYQRSNKDRQKRHIISYDIFFQLFKSCIDHNENKILKMVMDSFREEFLFEEMQDVRMDVYKKLQRMGLYCLVEKKMSAFAELIRFLVTRDLDLFEMNNLYSDILPYKPSKDELTLNLLLMNIDTEDVDEYDHLFELAGDLKYLKIKFYMIFYSYYRLQNRISPDRISTYSTGMLVDEKARNKIPYYLVRTVLLDLETHIKNWDKLFVSQSSSYFVSTAFTLLKLDEVRFLSEESEHEKSELLENLREKITNQSYLELEYHYDPFDNANK